MNRGVGRGREPPLLWAGLLAGPIAWLGQLASNYALTGWACHSGHRWPMSVVDAVALALVALGTLAVRRERRVVSDGPSVTARRRAFLSAFGLGLCALFAAVVLATVIPRLVIDPCIR